MSKAPKYYNSIQIKSPKVIYLLSLTSHLGTPSQLFEIY